ncbi:MAG: alkaline phosphatase [Leeuwenhoekiella sp.]|nr:MAG: alkaline phosphatase [Leeuwenhoekiella sp.]
MKSTGKKQFSILLFCVLVFQTLCAQNEESGTFKILFGSCNRTELPNPFWDQMSAAEADVFIWGGDAIYADTRNMRKMKRMYNAQKNIPEYKAFAESIPVMGTWDDHDYGLNDAGAEYAEKQKSQQLFLDFIGIPEDAETRQTEGVYTSKDFKVSGKTIKLIVLDTRYFRSSLKRATDPEKRYAPSTDTTTTMLGKEQWAWLENELSEAADFTVIMSSVQFLSNEHGFETWGNFPHEATRFERLIKESNSKAIIFSSGDRHIAEFSKKELPGLEYPLIDFTSSGLTHTYTSFDGEPNAHRVGEVVTRKNYGLIAIDLITKEVDFKIMGENNQVLQALTRDY